MNDPITPAATDNSTLTPSHGEEVRLGQLTGDRRCHACNFNLRGQTIVRESHYQMVMVRCPECGTPAPLTDYPRLGPWSRRLGMLAAIAWFITLIAGFLISGGLLAGMTQLTLAATVEPLAVRIATDFDKFAKVQLAAQTANPSPNFNQMYQWQAGNTPTSNSWIDNDWWKKQDKMIWKNAVTPAFNLFSGEAFMLSAFSSVFLTPFAIVLACSMPHLRGVRRALIPVGVLAVATLIMTIVFISDKADGAHNAMMASIEIIGPGVIVLQLLVLCVPIILGVLIGRPIARILIRWLVPPRQYVHFGFLWAADGLNQPASK